MVDDEVDEGGGAGGIPENGGFVAEGQVGSIDDRQNPRQIGG